MQIRHDGGRVGPCDRFVLLYKEENTGTVEVAAHTNAITYDGEVVQTHEVAALAPDSSRVTRVELRFATPGLEDIPGVSYIGAIDGAGGHSVGVVLHYNSTVHPEEDPSAGARLFFCGFDSPCTCGVDATAGDGVWVGDQYYPWDADAARDVQCVHPDQVVSRDFGQGPVQVRALAPIERLPLGGLVIYPRLLTHAWGGGRGRWRCRGWTCGSSRWSARRCTGARRRTWGTRRGSLWSRRSTSPPSTASHVTCSPTNRCSPPPLRRSTLASGCVALVDTARRSMDGHCVTTASLRV